MDFFIEYKTVFLILHILGTSLGVGGATITDVMFFKFLKDFKISHGEANVMKIVSSVIWVGLALLYISGFALFMTNPEVYAVSSKFLTKMFIVFVITVNGIFLHYFITPRLKHISFNEKHLHFKGELHVSRKFAFASGAISITSWYLAFILGVLRSIPLPSVSGILLYIGVLFLAVGGSQLVEWYLDVCCDKK